MTFVQIVVFITSVSVFGIAPIGVGKKVEKQDVLVTALYPQTIGFEEPENFWIGPRQVGLCSKVISYRICRYSRITLRMGDAFASEKTGESRDISMISSNSGGLRPSE